MSIDIVRWICTIATIDFRCVSAMSFVKYLVEVKFYLNHVINRLHGLLESPIDSFPTAFADLSQIKE